MTVNWMGLVAALATFFAIWFGHVGVRKIEAASPTIWLPTVIAVTLGLALEVAALLAPNNYLSGALGIVGVTVLWDALEFTRQHNRIKHGHAPANPNNPRHVQLMKEHPEASSIDWLNRDPIGRRVSREEALALVQQAGHGVQTSTQSRMARINE